MPEHRRSEGYGRHHDRQDAPAADAAVGTRASCPVGGEGTAATEREPPKPPSASLRRPTEQAALARRCTRQRAGRDAPLRLLRALVLDAVLVALLVLVLVVE